MKHYKRRTIALILASALTVVGAFGDSNYKNSIMSLKFENNASGQVNMTVFTKTSYDNNITPVKRDANTYVIMLPETNSQMNTQPTLSGNVESIDIRTMPYTNSSKGYTKITIKTLANTQLNTQKALYIEEKKDTESTPLSNNQIPEQTNIQSHNIQETPAVRNNTPAPSTRNELNNITDTSKLRKDNDSVNTSNDESSEQDTSYSSENDINNNNEAEHQSSNNYMEIVYLLFGILLIITFSAYLFVKGNNKISEIIGEQSKYDLDDDTNKKPVTANKTSDKKIKKTIKKLDEMYKKPISMPIGQNEISTISDFKENENFKDVIDDSNIVDLDELFNEQTKNIDETIDEENQNLDDFLADFFGEENETSENADEIQKNADADNLIDELFNKIKSNNSIKFTTDDINNINALINVELSDEFINEIKKYQQDSKIDNTQNRTVESMVTDMLNIHNISFSGEDIDAIEKIMNVELDPDFVTNLHTNPIQNKKVESHILNNVDKKHNTKEILVLNVKDELPDLSKELENKKAIEYTAKPQTIFCESGYEVNILHSEDLPDLSLEIGKQKDIEYVPSVDIVQADDYWEHPAKGIATISVAEELPNLEDVKLHPQKYEEKKKKPKANEKNLIKNLNSVVFKPFYDGNEQKEINKDKPDIQLNDWPSELFTFSDEQNTLIENTDKTVSEIKTDNEDYILPKPPVRTKVKREQDSETKNLLNKINERQNKQKSNASSLNTDVQKIQGNENKEKAPKLRTKCTVDGLDYSIIAVSKFTDEIGCYLATSVEEGYTILGFIGDNIFKVKQYEKVRNSNLQARVSEKLDNGTLRYIVRIGIHKFILDVSDDKMEYVMDLC